MPGFLPLFAIFFRLVLDGFGFIPVFPPKLLLTLSDVYPKLCTKLVTAQTGNKRGARSGIFHNLMATTLAPVDSREVVRCDRCQLVQFRSHSNLCRRCKLSLDDEPEPEVVQQAPAVEPVMMHRQGLQVASAIRNLRLRSGLSQRQLAMRMSVPRTYVSKIENEKATPTLSSLERLAKALEVDVTELITGGMAGREAELRELTQDAFIAELIPFLGKLNGMQWQSVLSQMRDLSTRPRRTA